MAFNLLKSFMHAEYLPLLKYANPKLLSVLPLEKLIQFGTHLKKAPTPPFLEGIKSPSVDKSKSLLTLYFYQIHSLQDWAIDLSLDHLTSEEPGILVWKPRGFYFTPSLTFREGLKQVYEGYYENNQALFNQGIESMGLTPAKDIMLAHFGTDGTRSIVFDPKALSHTIEQLTERALEKKMHLDENFLAFGVMLLTLYQSMGRSEQAWDVKQCYLDSLKLGTE